jgi:hypothetical protein
MEESQKWEKLEIIKQKVKCENEIEEKMEWEVIKVLYNVKVAVEIKNEKNEQK